MPWKDPEKRREHARKVHAARPEVDRAKQRHRTKAEAIFRQRYKGEYDKLVKSLGYEGVKGNARYVQALREVKRRHPKAWANAREEAKADG